MAQVGLTSADLSSSEVLTSFSRFSASVTYMPGMSMPVKKNRSPASGLPPVVAFGMNRPVASNSASDLRSVIFHSDWYVCPSWSMNVLLWSGTGYAAI